MVSHNLVNVIDFPIYRSTDPEAVPISDEPARVLHLGWFAITRKRVGLTPEECKRIDDLATDYQVEAFLAHLKGNDNPEPFNKIELKVDAYNQATCDIVSERPQD